MVLLTYNIMKWKSEVGKCAVVSKLSTLSEGFGMAGLQEAKAWCNEHESVVDGFVRALSRGSGLRHIEPAQHALRGRLPQRQRRGWAALR